MKVVKLIFFILFLVALYFLLNLVHKKDNLYDVTINNKKIVLEIAKTEQQREYGLMDRKFMPKNHGMIFLFDHPQRLSFWMKNTLIPLDMIFLNHGHVVAILNDVPPCKQVNCPSYEPNVQANQVIELNAGMAKKINIREDTLIAL
jgi:uncharacterized membrane protein (UPF0127 family)